MIVLHIENNNLFSANMLLGAMIDMGASVFYIENGLKDMGIDADILHDTVKRDGMEAEYAYTKVRFIPDDIKMPSDISHLSINPMDLKEKSAEDICTFFAVLFAINTFSPDYITYDKEIIAPEFDKQLLKCICNEQTHMPQGDIICVGYGAGDADILRAVLYKNGSDMIIKELFKESVL